jgi:hypothetical protein
VCPDIETKGHQVHSGFYVGTHILICTLFSIQNKGIIVNFQVHHARCVYVNQKKEVGVRLKTQLSWFCILLPIVTTCLGLARPSSGRNVVHKGENTHNCLYTGVM